MPAHFFLLKTFLQNTHKTSQTQIYRTLEWKTIFKSKNDKRLVGILQVCINTRYSMTSYVTEAFTLDGLQSTMLLKHLLWCSHFLVSRFSTT